MSRSCSVILFFLIFCYEKTCRFMKKCIIYIVETMHSGLKIFAFLFSSWQKIIKRCNQGAIKSKNNKFFYFLYTYNEKATSTLKQHKFHLMVWKTLCVIVMNYVNSVLLWSPSSTMNTDKLNSVDRMHEFSLITWSVLNYWNLFFTCFSPLKILATKGNRNTALNSNLCLFSDKDATEELLVIIFVF